MGTELENWTKYLAESPFSKSKFTPELQERVIDRIEGSKFNQTHKRIRSKGLRLKVICGFIILLGGMGLLWKQTNVIKDVVKFANLQDNWKIRQQYVSRGDVLFRVYTDGDNVAGKKNTFLWVFEQPLDQLKGHEISVEAIHQETGTALNVTPSQIITESVRRTGDQTGVVTSFGLPYEGKWRLEVSLNGVYYGDVIVIASAPAWQISNNFEWNSMNFQGEEQRIGVRGPDLKAGMVNKYMWYLNGKKEELIHGSLKVVAVQQYTGRIETVINFLSSMSSWDEEDIESYSPSSITLPEPGLWRLMVMSKDQLFGSLVVEVK